jgi:predicted nucleic acid-binding protein
VTHGLDTSFLVAAEVSCHSDHTAARTLASSFRQNGDHFALAPQAVAEFVHIVTDARRFTAPLTMPQALERARIWWDAAACASHGHHQTGDRLAGRNSLVPV